MKRGQLNTAAFAAALALVMVACVSPSDEELLQEIDAAPEGGASEVSDEERESYDAEGFEFDDGLLSDEELEEGELEEDEDEQGEDGEEEGLEDDEEDEAEEGVPETSALELPEYFESRDLERFLRDRSTLMAPFEPLTKKYQAYHREFAPGLRQTPEAVQRLKEEVFQNVAQAHWVFLKGLETFVLQLEAEAAKGLRERKKRVIVHHMRALTFLGKSLDEKTQDTRYREFVRRVYKKVVARHLYRPVRKRKR